MCVVAILGFIRGSMGSRVSADDATASATAQAIPSGASVDSESGTVSLIDQKNAIIVVARFPGHEDLSFNVRNHRDALNTIKVGDKLTASYLEPYVTHCRFYGVPAHLDPRGQGDPVSAGRRAGKFQALGLFQGVVEVTAVNRKLNLLTVEDKGGTAHSVRVSSPELVKVIRSLARHSHVRIAYESETTVIVTR